MRCKRRFMSAGCVVHMSAMGLNRRRACGAASAGHIEMSVLSYRSDTTRTTSPNRAVSAWASRDSPGTTQADKWDADGLTNDVRMLSGIFHQWDTMQVIADVWHCFCLLVPSSVREHTCLKVSRRQAPGDLWSFIHPNLASTCADACKVDTKTSSGDK